MQKNIDPIGKETLDVMRAAPFYNKWLFSFFRPHLKGRILEAGAGTGTFSEYFSKSSSDFTAVDYNKEYINLLKKKYNAGFGDIQKGEFFFKNKKFDTIVTLNVVEHIKDDITALKNFYELLNEGGKLLILVPAHKFAYSDIDKNLGHYRRYSTVDLSTKLKKAGFAVKESRYLNLLGLVGWFLSGKVFGKSQLETGQLSIFETISKPLLFLEKIVKMPVGLSVYIIAEKKSKIKKYKSVSVIIPAYNEEKTISEIIKKVKFSKINLKKEIIVVNDNSTDKTKDILEKISGIKLINHEINLGKGEAIKTALKNATGEIVIIQDADLEYDPEDYSKLLIPILNRKTSIVYGTRLRKLKLKLFGIDKTLHPENYIANKVLSMFTNLLFKTNITDMETCYKVFKRDLINPNILNSKMFEIEPELTALFAKQNERITEVDIKVKPRDYSDGKKIKPEDGVVAIKTLILEKFIR